MRSLSHDKLEVRADGKNENKIGSENGIKRRKGLKMRQQHVMMIFKEG